MHQGQNYTPESPTFLGKKCIVMFLFNLIFDFILAFTNIIKSKGFWQKLRIIIHFANMHNYLQIIAFALHLLKLIEN